MDVLAQLAELEENDSFVRRHIGPSETELAAMLHAVGAATLDDVAGKTVPDSIRSNQALNLPPDLETWARQTALAIRLGQGRPALPAPSRELRGAGPLRMKPMVAWAWLSAAVLLAATVVCTVL